MSQENNFIPEQKIYKPLSPFKLFVKSNFPFIEATFEALDNYGLYCKIVEYLNTVISNENEVEENVRLLYNAFVELNNYVSNYFDNLDVQEEINNKLDDMAEAGTLEEIISAYLNSKAIFGFDNVSEMKEATNLIAGSYAKTLGFYEKNDGGAGLYKIRNYEISENINEMDLILINDEYVAELITINYISLEMLGSNNTDNDDDSEYLERAFEIAKTKKIDLIINNIHLIDNDITLDGNASNFNIISNGYLIPEGTINLSNIKDSTISIKLKNGGQNDIDSYGCIITKMKYCKIYMEAHNVHKTAFYVYTSNTNNTNSNWCECYVKGQDNLRTLLHGAKQYSSVDSSAFGSYIDIEDRSPSYGICFRACSDVTILHFENQFDDATWQKNSLEFLYCGVIHCSHVACGANAKNLIYLINTRIFIDNVFVLAEDKTEGDPNIPSVVTGIYAEGGGSIKINNITNHGCKYAVDMSQMTDQACKDSYIYNVYNLYDSISEQRKGGIYVPKVTNKILYNYNMNNTDIIKDAHSLITLNANITTNEFNVFKDGNKYEVVMSFSVSSNIASNSELFSIDTNFHKLGKFYFGEIYDRTSIALKSLCFIASNSFVCRNTDSLVTDHTYYAHITFYGTYSLLSVFPTF